MIRHDLKLFVMVFFFSRDLLTSIIEQKELTTRFWKSSLIRRQSPSAGYFVCVQFYHMSKYYALSVYQDANRELPIIILQFNLSTGATGAGFMPVWNSITFLYHNLNLAYGPGFNLNNFVVIHVLLNYLYPLARLGLLKFVSLTSIEVLGNATVVNGRVVMNSFIRDILVAYVNQVDCPIVRSLGNYVQSLTIGQGIPGSECLIEYICYLAVLQEETPRADLNGFVTLSIPGVKDSPVVKEEIPTSRKPVELYYTDATPIFGPNSEFQDALFNTPAVQNDMRESIRAIKAEKAKARAIAAAASTSEVDIPKPKGGRRRQGASLPPVREPSSQDLEKMVSSLIEKALSQKGAKERAEDSS